jgi:hypothetical protein
MTAILERAFAEAAKLPEREQELLATRLLAELSAENAFDRTIESSGHRLAGLAEAALEEDRAGLTEELIPERL